MELHFSLVSEQIMSRLPFNNALKSKPHILQFLRIDDSLDCKHVIIYYSYEYLYRTTSIKQNSGQQHWAELIAACPQTNFELLENDI